MSRAALVTLILIVAGFVAYGLLNPTEDAMSLCGIGCSRELR